MTGVGRGETPQPAAPEPRSGWAAPETWALDTAQARPQAGQPQPRAWGALGERDTEARGQAREPLERIRTGDALGRS